MNYTLELPRVKEEKFRYHFEVIQETYWKLNF